MKNIIFIISFFALSCVKEESCDYTLSGTWDLVRIVKNGQVVCVYGNTFYYTYTFAGSKATSTQYRNGVDSLVGTFDVDCNNIFVTWAQDTVYYGGLTNYAVLAKQ